MPNIAHMPEPLKGQPTAKATGTCAKRYHTLRNITYHEYIK